MFLEIMEYLKFGEIFKKMRLLNKQCFESLKSEMIENRVTLRINDSEEFKKIKNKFDANSFLICDVKINNKFIKYLRESFEIKKLNIMNCNRITDNAFIHLKGIHTLKMNTCNQITDKAFIHLKGIHTLNMRLCSEITDKAFIHLKGIHTLNMSCM